MAHLFTLGSKLLSVGLLPGMSPRAQMAVRLSNLVALVISGVALVYISVLLWVQGLPFQGVLPHVAVLLASLAALFCNYCKLYAYARGLLIVVLSFTAFGASVVFGRATNSLLFLVLPAILVYFFYEKSSIQWLYLAFVAVLFGIGVLLLERSTFYPLWLVAARAKVWYTAPLLDSALVLGMLLLFTIRFVRANERYMTLVEAQKREIEVRRDALAQKNQEILLQNEQLEDSEGELLKMNALNRRLFALVSHDLRNALYGLQHYVLNNQQDMEAFRRQVGDSLQQNTQLLEELLQWSASQLGAWPSERQGVALAEALARSVALVRPLALAKDIAIATHAAHGTKASANKQMLDIVLRNLLSNAAKHTQAGGSITVSVSENGPWVEVAVADTGPGLAPGQLEGLWEGRSKSGSLGLVLCHDYVKQMEGRLWATSQPGRGSVFTVALPKAV